MVELDHLNKSFGAEAAVRDVSLSVAQGEFVTLLGSGVAWQDGAHPRAERLGEPSSLRLLRQQRPRGRGHRRRRERNSG